MRNDENPRPIPRWVWVLAVALIVLAAVTAWQAQRFAGDLGVLRLRVQEERARGVALESEQARYQQALNIVAASATKEIKLKPAASSSGGASKDDAPALSAYWNPQMGLVLSADNIAQPALGRVLQLWIAPSSGAPVSAGIFRPNASGQVLLVAPALAAMTSAKALMVTDEPTGGSPQPTTAPKWSAAIAAK